MGRFVDKKLHRLLQERNTALIEENATLLASLESIARLAGVHETLPPHELERRIVEEFTLLRSPATYSKDATGDIRRASAAHARRMYHLPICKAPADAGNDHPDCTC